MEIDGPVPGIPGAVVRRVEALPAKLANARSAGQFAQASHGRLLLDVPRVARYLIRDGESIEVAVEPDADPGAVVLVLNGSARGALIHQRGELPLHAATLVPPHGRAALSICGPSGAGKSTLAMELSRRGWILIADDTTRVAENGGDLFAWPSRDSIKLWRDACERNDLDVGRLERVTRDLEKYYVRVAARYAPARLAMIVELAGDGAQIDDCISAGDRMTLITRNTCRPSQIVPRHLCCDAHIQEGYRGAIGAASTRLLQNFFRSASLR